MKCRTRKRGRGGVPLLMPSLYALTALPFTLLLIARLSTFTLAFPTGPIRRRSANRITRLHDSNSFSEPFPSPRPRVSFLFRMCRGIAQGTEDTVFEIGIRKWEEERYRERDPCPPPPHLPLRLEQTQGIGKKNRPRTWSKRFRSRARG